MPGVREQDMTENKHASRFSKRLRAQGALVVPYVAGSHGLIGFPDKLVIHKLWTGVVEIKGPRTKVEEAQKQRMRQIDEIWPGHCVMARFEPDVGDQMSEWLVITLWRQGADADLGRCEVNDFLRWIREWHRSSQSP